MPPGEMQVRCPGCGNQIRVPFAALRRDNTYCSQCGKRIELKGVTAEQNTEGGAAAAPKRRQYRPARKRR